MCSMMTVGVRQNLKFGLEEIHGAIVGREGKKSAPSFCCICGLLIGVEARELLCLTSSELVPKKHKKTQ